MRISDWSSDVCSSDLSENVDILIDDLRCGCVESSAVDECEAAVESFGPGKHFLRRSPREGEKKNLLGWDAILDKHCSAPAQNLGLACSWDHEAHTPTSAVSNGFWIGRASGRDREGH